MTDQDQGRTPDAHRKVGAMVDHDHGLDVGESRRLDELAEIITAYNQVTEKLQHSHELLQAEVRRLQKELAGANAQLQRSRRLAALGEMAAGIAHEIRNPLGGIALYARMLREDLPEGGDHQQLACRIGEAVRSLDAIVGDVLHFSRELKPRGGAVLPADLFDRALAAHRPDIEAADVIVERDLVAEEDEAMAVAGDGDLLQQAMLNLVRNAVDAMAGEEGRPGVAVERRRLTLGVRREQGQVVLTVADRGPGIAEEDIDRLFNPFFTTRHTGTGLGLAIVHRIVDAHGGAVTVHNDETGGGDAGRGGAVFELWLPAAEPMLNELNDRNEDGCGSAGGRETIRTRRHRLVGIGSSA